MEGHSYVEAFRDWMIAEYRSDGRYERIQTLTGPDVGGAALSLRLHVGKRSYYEVRVDAELEELQVGFGTEHRTVNESIEDAILSAGGDLTDLLADELADLGEEPLPMEHFFERPTFRFITRIRLESPEALADPAVRRLTTHVIRSSQILFQSCVDES
jgi:hypothetical protein